MNVLDLRTVLLSGIISHGLCLWVMVSLWRRHRRRSPEVGWWLANHALQFVVIWLLALRGVIPDALSILPGIPLLVGGTLLLYMGLERYLGKPSSQRTNWVLLAGFTAAHLYCALVDPSLMARNLNATLGLLVVCSQCAWLLLRRVDSPLRPATRMAGVVFALYSLVSLARIFTTLAVPPGNDFLQSGLYDTLVIMIYQMLFIALTFSLFVMVNHRLFADLESDMAQRRRTEAALVESEAKFRVLAEESLVGVYVVQEGRMRYINAAGASLVGRSREELQAAPSALEVIVAEEDRPVVAEMIRRRLQGEARSLRYEFTALHKDGSRRVVEALGTVASYNGRPAIIGTAQDVTERRAHEERLRAAHEETAGLLQQARDSRAALLSLVEDQKTAAAALRESETLYRSTVSALIEGVLVFDAEGRVLLGNASAERILGLSLAEMRQHKSQLSDWRVVREDLTPFPHDELPVAQALVSGQSQRGVVFGNYRPDGMLTWLLVNAEPILESDTGRPGTVVVSFMDITERTQAELKNREQLQELRRWHDATLGREARILELKQQVNELLDKAGLPMRYRSVARPGAGPPDSPMAAREGSPSSSSP